jgi:hypothetical protein
MPDPNFYPKDHDTLIRLEEKAKEHEKRIGRLEIGFIAVFISGLAVIVKFMLANAGLLK